MPFLCVILSHAHFSCPYSQLLNGCSEEEWGDLVGVFFFFPVELLSEGLCLSNYMYLRYFIKFPFHLI